MPALAAIRRRTAAGAILLLAVSLPACRAGGEGTPPGRPGAGAEAPPSSGGAGGPAAGGGYGPPVLLGRLDPAVAESSGLVASRRNPGLLWTHNDSGDGPVVHCTDRRARPCGTWRVTGATARDWEGIAVGPGPQAGRSYLYVGDIGDNLRDQRQVVVYRVPEPAAPGPPGAPAATETAARIPLRYADGSHNAEALLVHPTSGDLYVVTKEPVSAGVYKAGPGGGVLQRVASLAVGPAPVTGGDIAPGGDRVALCTYSSGFELEVPAGDDFDSVWRQPLRPVQLAGRAQGEAIAYRLDGAALVTTSEGAPAPLYEVERRAP